MPELVIIAGPNGSGKSTLTEPTRLKRLGISFPENYINADEIAKKFGAKVIGRNDALNTYRLKFESAEAASAARSALAQYPGAVLD